MNLIEQLNEYENVNKHFNRIEYHAETKIFIGEWFGFYSMRDLKDALLEYRRQHNTFEIGDLYVFTEKYSKQSVIHKVDSLNSGKGCIRHATDVEIKAGRRL